MLSWENRLADKMGHAAVTFDKKRPHFRPRLHVV